MLRRIPDLQSVLKVRLPKSRRMFHLRKTADPTRMGTMEAIARALEILEGPQIRDHCEKAISVLAGRSEN
jgi:DTW domain-containing protein YfiP